ncbi:MAG: hypothetical protein QOG01_3024 [Pseudonocardiales bacterium]|nr:hypothetical protein [Pseudonocardiales bacterium]
MVSRFAGPVLRPVLLGMAASALLTGCGAATTGGAGQAGQQSSVPATSSTVPAVRVPTPAITTRSPKPNACAHTTARQLVQVSLAKQHLWMCAHKHLVYSTAITSGIVGQYTSTPTGTYVIEGRNRNTVLTLNTGATYDVKYWIPFDAPLFGFHDSSWQDFPYGSPKYKTQGSHGCVHMPLKAIAFLYRWAHVGALVKIRA